MTVRFILQLEAPHICPKCRFPLATNPRWPGRRPGEPNNGHHSRCAKDPSATSIIDVNVTRAG